MNMIERRVSAELKGAGKSRVFFIGAKGGLEGGEESCSEIKGGGG